VTFVKASRQGNCKPSAIGCSTGHLPAIDVSNVVGTRPAGARFAFGQFSLKDSLGALELSAAAWREMCAGAIDEVLNHSNTGAQPFGRHIGSRHDASDLAG
jgi:hypothetical protein